MGTVTRLAKAYPRRRGSKSTQLQRLAQQRNWCCYIIKGMEALTMFMSKNGWLSTSAENTLLRGLTQARFSVENQYYVKREEQDL